MAPEARYDAVADFYIENRYFEFPGGFSVATSGLLPDVAGLDLLDIGCGEGHLARRFTTEGATVTGVELSTTLLARARSIDEPTGITYVLGDAADPALLAGASFDLVTANMSLSDI